MKIDVYLQGCSTCGTNAIYLNRLKRSHEINVYNSFQKDNDLKHKEYLLNASMENTPIIVVNDGERILRLEEWKYL